MVKEEVERLESKIQHLEDRRLDKIEATLAEVIANQREMEKQLERYSARWGFVLMVGSALIAALKIFWGDIIRFVK